MKRELMVLALSSTILLVGLGLWFFVDRHRTVPDADLLAALAAPQPPIGEPLDEHDPRRAALLTALLDAELGPYTLARLYREGDREVLAVVTSGANARAALDALRAVRASTGLTPVVLGNGRSVEILVRDAALEGASPEAIVRRAAALEVERAAVEPGAPLATLEASDVPLQALVDPALHLPWPEVAIGLFPALDGVEDDHPGAPLAWLDFGNWRGCPEAATHVATIDRLASLGARLIAVGPDTIELEVAAPLTPEQRIEAAQIIAAYAPSTLRRDDGTERPASELLARPVWTLRWPRPR